MLGKVSIGPPLLLATEAGSGAVKAEQPVG